METYGKILLIAMPAFLLLVLFEKWYGWRKGMDTVRINDMISSLSSGMTNATKDVLGLSLAIISYGWFVDKLAITHVESSWMAYAIAFLVLDFSGYWVHRIAHEYNLFWNNHKLENIAPVNESFLVTSNTKEVLIYWTSHLALFNLNSELIEIKDGFSTKNAESLGTDSENNFYLKTKTELLIGNSDLDFKVIGEAKKTITWASSKPTDSQTIKALNSNNFQKDLHYERLVIDIHNGNIFGYLNKFLIDFLSILFLLLIFSGLYIWFQKLHKK